MPSKKKEKINSKLVVKALIYGVIQGKILDLISAEINTHYTLFNISGTFNAMVDFITKSTMYINVHIKLD